MFVERSSPAAFRFNCRDWRNSNFIWSWTVIPRSLFCCVEHSVLCENVSKRALFLCCSGLWVCKLQPRYDCPWPQDKLLCNQRYERQRNLAPDFLLQLLAETCKIAPYWPGTIIGCPYNSIHGFVSCWHLLVEWCLPQPGSMLLCRWNEFPYIGDLLLWFYALFTFVS